MDDLTETQHAMLAMIGERIAADGVPPSQTEIARAFGFRGVRAETLEHFGAVSRETVIEMVSGALSHSGASIAVAVTGIAGPGGGTVDKPVGMVWIAWKRRGGYPRAEAFNFEGDREAVRRRTVAAALLGLSTV